jgi:alkanesulfonate monooxygenase SsuD/methylene tetrahydromethanopterin reductase-like flavin-dependent oxidoreductase (luciferase family)
LPQHSPQSYGQSIPHREEISVSIRVGLSVTDALLVPKPADRRLLLDSAAEAGLDHITVGDHISFHGGTGFDGMVSATTVLSSHDTLSVIIGVYLLGLRHPMLAARQIATLSQIAPGRLVVGAGVGGEDRSEISNSGVDPSTRGRRLDETLAVLRAVLTGEEVTHHGEFFTLDQARILPAPRPAVPILIGGRGESAIRRTARYGDGWLGIFCTPRRFSETRTAILDAAARESRAPDSFGRIVWWARRCRRCISCRATSSVTWHPPEHPSKWPSGSTRSSRQVPTTSPWSRQPSRWKRRSSTRPRSAHYCSAITADR